MYFLISIVELPNKRPMGHIAHLRNQFKSMNPFEPSYDYTDPEAYYCTLKVFRSQSVSFRYQNILFRSQNVSFRPQCILNRIPYKPFKPFRAKRSVQSIRKSSEIFIVITKWRIDIEV